MHSAYILHTRAYRETSLLVEALTAEHGRIALVARGAKRGKSKQSSLLQPFLPLNIAWFGDGDLVTLTTLEQQGIGHSLCGRDAICGLYINELLVKLLPKWDACSAIFANYQQALVTLGSENEVVLRKFEKELLRAMGYGLQLTKEVLTGELVQAGSYYAYDPTIGPSEVKNSHVGALRGSSLLALEDNDYVPEALADIKRLMRVVLSYHLGAKKIVTRELL